MYTTIGTNYSFQTTVFCPGRTTDSLLHVSGVSRPIIRRYNRMYTTIGTYHSF